MKLLSYQEVFKNITDKSLSENNKRINLRCLPSLRGAKPIQEVEIRLFNNSSLIKAKKTADDRFQTTGTTPKIKIWWWMALRVTPLPSLIVDCISKHKENLTLLRLGTATHSKARAWIHNTNKLQIQVLASTRQANSIWHMNSSNQPKDQRVQVRWLNQKSKLRHKKLLQRRKNFPRLARSWLRKVISKAT